MLAKKYRLPVQDFISKRGQIIKTQYFLLKKISSSNNSSRFGVTVSVKTAKKATERNRSKRVAYNFIREYYKEIPAADYWITILAPAVNLPKEKFQKELGKLLISNF